MKILRALLITSVISVTLLSLSGIAAAGTSIGDPHHPQMGTSIGDPLFPFPGLNR